MASLFGDPNPAQADTVAVGPSRLPWAFFTAFFGVIGAVGGARAATAGSATGVIIVLFLFAPLFAFSMRVTVRRRPLVVIDDHGFTDGRSGRTVPWDAIEQICANTHQGAYGVDHSLRLVLKRRAGQPLKRRFITTNATADDEIEVSLDGLALPRDDVITAIERNFGHPVLRTSDAGLQSLRRRRR